MIFKTVGVVCLHAVSLLAGTCSDPGTLHAISGNFSSDQVGTQDTRQYTWGKAAAEIKVLTFDKVPAGCRVELVKMTGDFIGYALGAVPAGTQAGVLIGVSRSGAGLAGSHFADFAADGVYVYRQATVDSQSARLAINDTFVDSVLNEDNVVWFKIASWLNNTGLTIHMEVSFVLQFHYI